MSYISELLKSAFVLPEYRDWPSTKTIVQARIALLLMVLLLSLLLAVFSSLAFGIGFSLALGLGLAVTLDLGFAGGIEAVKRLVSSWIGQEKAEARRIEKLARIDANGFPLNPRFIRGLHQGLWLSVDELERAIGKHILASQARKFGKAVDIKEHLWMPVSNAAVLARQVEPLGMQFVSIWLENTALSYWGNLTSNMVSDANEHHQ